MSKREEDRKAAQERAEKFLYDFVAAYRTYHNHKERNAYVSFLVYFTFFASALLLGDWPLHKEKHIPDVVTIICVTIFWLYALIFMKWQLRNRRIAAIYVAAAQESLAVLLADTAPISKFRPASVGNAPRNSKQEDGLARRLQRAFWLTVDHIWPININKHIHVDVDPGAYPLCLVEALERKYQEGTGAIVHERLLVLLGWLIYVGIVIRIIVLQE